MRIITLLAIITLITPALSSAQTTTELVSSGTSGDAILKIESDTDNNNESDNSRIELYQDAGSLGAYIGFNSDWGGTTNQPDNLFRIGTRFSNVDYFNRLVIRGNTGHVGIGTSDPISLFHISSLTSGDAILTLEADTDNNNESDNPEIKFVQDGGLVNGFIGFEGNANTKSTGTLANAFLLGSEDLGNTRPIQLVVADEVQITVKDDGVGIGTTNPSANLEISSTADTELLLRASGGNNNSFINFIESTGTNGIQIGQDGTENYFYIAGGNPATTKHLIVERTTGNVGIGTTDPNPDFKLSVNGSIRSKEVKVEANWSDFVFEDDYELRTLEEVEEHINRNGHLPEIPSEAEVTENGINLGEMDAKLLQKIEELTLYLIEQNKEIKELREEVSNLKNE